MRVHSFIIPALPGAPCGEVYGWAYAGAHAEVNGKKYGCLFRLTPACGEKDLRDAARQAKVRLRAQLEMI